jgi:hypothetical protein
MLLILLLQIAIPSDILVAGPVVNLNQRGQPVDDIVRKAIDGVKGNGYNPSNGKPGQHRGLRKE